jgi:hypothetical protein
MRVNRRWERYRPFGGGYEIGEPRLDLVANLTKESDLFVGCGRSRIAEAVMDPLPATGKYRA